ncbi:MAG: hypothetical protein M1541_03615 [Acidobacteria bacterium]|nr:hypothetical protein [Acidobacteriota bacterium]
MSKLFDLSPETPAEPEKPPEPETRTTILLSFAREDLELRRCQTAAEYVHDLSWANFLSGLRDRMREHARRI